MIFVLVTAWVYNQGPDHLVRKLYHNLFNLSRAFLNLFLVSFLPNIWIISKTSGDFSCPVIATRMGQNISARDNPATSLSLS